MDISAIAAGASASLSGGADLALRKAQSPAQQRKAVAGQFEAIMLRQFLGNSIGSMMGGEDSPAGSVYGYMMTDVLSQKLAQGAGMGLSKIIEQQLTPRGTPLAGTPEHKPSA